VKIQIFSLVAGVQTLIGLRVERIVLTLTTGEAIGSAKNAMLGTEDTKIEIPQFFNHIDIKSCLT
jgi:hypothetical protein